MKFLFLFSISTILYANFFNSELEKFSINLKNNNIISIADIIKSEDLNYKILQKNKKYVSSNLLNSYLSIFDYKNKEGIVENFYIFGDYKNIYDIDEFQKIENSFKVKNKKIIKNYDKKYIDFDYFMNIDKDSLNYILIFLKLERKSKIQIRFSSKDKMRVFIDKKKIFTKDYISDTFFDKNNMLLELNKGIHSILFKIKRDDKNKFYLRILGQNFKSILLYSYPKKYPNFKLIKNNLLLDELEKIKEKNYLYYLNRAIIEKYFTDYNIDIEPHPYEGNFKKALTLAKNDKEKSEIYYYWSKNTSSKVLSESLLDKSFKLNYYLAIIEKILFNIKNYLFLDLKKLFKRAKKIDDSYYKLILLEQEYYSRISLSSYYLKKLKKFKINFDYFNFQIKYNTNNLKEKIKLLEENKNKYFFNENLKIELLNLYIYTKRYKKYENYLLELIKNDKYNIKIIIKLMKYYFSNKNYNKIFNLYEIYKEVYYDNPDILKILGDSYQVINEIKKSIEYYKKYLEINQNDNNIKRLIEILNSKKASLWAKKYQSYFKKVIPNNKDKKEEVLWSNTIIKVNDDFTYNLYKNYSKRINDLDILKNSKTISIYYNSEEDLNFSSLKVIRNNNEINVREYRDFNNISENSKVISSLSRRVYILPKLKRGDIIEYEAYISNKNKFYNRDFYSSSFYLRDNIFNHRKSFLFILPNGINLNSNKNLKKIDNNYYYEGLNLKKIENEVFSSGYSSNYGLLVVSTMKTWNNFIKWYSNLIKDTKVLTIDFIKKLKKETKNLNKLEKIKYVHNYVIKNIHYISVALGVNGIKPRKSMDILKSKYGDCKDSANLFVNILNSLGINANLVLIRTNNLGNIKMKNIINYDYFNHAIAYIKDYDLFLDLTSRYSGINDLPYLDQGASYLLIKDNETIRKTPVFTFEENIILDVKKDKNNLKAKVRIETKGSINAEYRYYFDDEEKKEKIENIISKNIKKKFLIENLKIENLNNLNKNLILIFNLEIKDFFNNNKIPLTIFMNSLKKNILYSKRDSDIRHKIFKLKETIKLENIKISEYNTKLKNDFFDFYSKAEYEKEKFVINNVYINKKNIIKKNNYNKFKKEYLKLIKTLKQDIEIK